MRKSRIICWIICLAIALGLFVGEGWIRNHNAEKLPVKVYAPSDMKKAFGRALKSADMKGDYEIVMTDDISTANIIVEMGKEYDSNYQELAYTPFIVMYSTEDDQIKNMKKAGVLQDAFFDDDYEEINFLKVIEEAIGDGKWENLGVKEMGNLQVFYPAPETGFYSYYYDFMLVTVNGGIYPKTEDEMKKAIEQIKLFEESKYTEAISDFEEKLMRTGGFQENAFWLLPEKVAGELCNGNSKYGRAFYPTTTTYVYWYIKADNLGERLIKVFDDPNTFNGNFYDYIEDKEYRNVWDNMLNGISDYMYDERDVYNLLRLEKDRIRPESVIVEEP